MPGTGRARQGRRRVPAAQSGELRKLLFPLLLQGANGGFAIADRLDAVNDLVAPCFFGIVVFDAAVYIEKQNAQQILFLRAGELLELTRYCIHKCSHSYPWCLLFFKYFL